jgi:pimeloyl-ACP methyl ester carboxylesterase
MPQVQRNGLELHYLDVGRGEPVVLLLHAFPLSGDMFRPQLQELSAKYRFLVPDQRGFGRSGAAEGPTEMGVLAQDALSVLDAAKVKTAVVCGVSLGGYVALALLRQDAGRVRALVLADTHPYADDEAGKQKREETAAMILGEGMGALAEQMLPKLVSASAPPALVSDVRRMILEGSPAGAAAASRGMGLRQDSRDVLSRFAGPVLVVHGEQDALIPGERFEQMTALASGAKRVSIPKAGHLPNLEAPAEFNRALDEFLSALR